MRTHKRVLALVPSPDRRDVLMRDHGDGGKPISLPEAWCAESDEEVGSAIACIRERFGITSPFLRRCTVGRDVEGTMVWLLEFDSVKDTGRLSAQTHWRPLEELNTLAVPAVVTDALREWLTEQHTGTFPSLRAPWARPGWHAAVSRWISQQLVQQGIDPLGEPAVVQQWGISAVLRQQTKSGNFYAKAVFGSPGRGFWHEPAVTLALANETDGEVPQVTSIESRQGWMLMPDMHISELDTKPIAHWQQALQSLARIQRSWMNRRPELSALGCPVRAPDVLNVRLPEMLDTDVVSTGLTLQERKQIKQLLPTFNELCKRALDGPIPIGLMHGDCHPGNVGLRSDATTCIYDWSDAAIGHPFWDVAVFTDHAPPAWRQALWETYLDSWKDFADLAQLREVLAEATVLTYLNQVVTYSEILQLLEPAERESFSGHAERWWRKALASVQSIR